MVLAGWHIDLAGLDNVALTQKNLSTAGLCISSKAEGFAKKEHTRLDRSEYWVRL